MRLLAAGFVIAFTLLGFGETARILAVFPYCGKSHALFYKPLLSGLAERGHDVVLLSSSKIFTESLPRNVTQIVPQGLNEAVFKAFPDFIELRRTGWGNHLMFFLRLAGYAACDFLLGTNEAKEVLNSKTRFHVLLTGSIVNECALAFAYKLQVPYITITSAGLVPWIDNAVWNPQPWAYVPNLYLPYSDHMTFSQRFYNVFYSLASRFNRELIYFSEMDRIIGRHLGDDIPSLRELDRNASLVIVNGDHSSDYPRPNLPTIIALGAMQCRPPKPLPPDLAKFVDGSGDAGFIIFSMGSVVTEEIFPKEILQEFVAAFSRIPQRVIWKWAAQAPVGLSSNVKLVKWLPQQDLLGDEHARVIITHGGLGTCQEAIYHRVPLIGLPVFGDQDWNTMKAVSDGSGVLLDLLSVTADIIVESLNMVINTTSYRENMERRSRIMKDKPVDPVQLGVYWTEYVIRHKGARHLRSAALDLAWYQLYLLDVIAAAALIVLVPSVVTWKLIRRLLRKPAKPAKDNKKKIN